MGGKNTSSCRVPADPQSFVEEESAAEHADAQSVTNQYLQRGRYAKPSRGAQQPDSMRETRGRGEPQPVKQVRALIRRGRKELPDGGFHYISNCVCANTAVRLTRYSGDDERHEA